MATEHPLHIVRGKTLTKVIRWETKPMVSKPITAISLASGFPRLTVPAHGLISGQGAAVFGVVGMKQINALNTPLRDADFREATAIDADTIEFNGLVPIDDSGAKWPDYESGGFLAYYTPMDFSSYTPEVVIKDKIGGTVLLSSRAADAPLNLLTATKDNVAKTVTVTIPADVAAAITWKKAKWEVEMRASAADVKSLIAPSDVTTGDEVVT